MRTPKQIYETYRIMPQLALHQLRVAAVAQSICDAFQGPIARQDVILTCLFHDMGNIIKFDLGAFTDLFDSGNRPQWEAVKADYIARYGNDSHHANVAISEELGLPEAVIRYIDGISFSKMAEVRESDSYEQKICEYADMRVGPYSILSMADRITDMHQRYKAKYSLETPENRARIAGLERAAREVERQIFERTSISPRDITDASVAPIIETLKDYQVG